jgi:hypothetical protein
MSDNALISSVTPLPLQQAVRTWPVPKELIRAVTKVVAGIAAVVFILARFTTTTGVLLFVGSVVVLLVCFGVLKLLEDDDENTGYWPHDPKQ